MHEAPRRPVVAVFGSSTLDESAPEYDRIVELGGELARGGFAVMTGGYDGAMAAASRGAREAGARVIGVTVETFERRGPVNRWVNERVHTPDLFERLRHLVREADAFVVVTGSVGTLTELFLVWSLLAAAARPAAPLVLMGEHWREWLALHRGPGFVPESLFRWVEIAEGPAAAAELVARALERAADGALPRTP